MHGWDIDRWCTRCIDCWEFATADGHTRETYERESDLALAHAALVALASGAIPIAPLLSEFDLGTAFTERMPSPSE
jgi:hypothetical protein